MDVLVERITNKGKLVYHAIRNINKLVVFDDVKAQIQIGKDMLPTEPVKPKEMFNDSRPSIIESTAE